MRPLGIERLSVFNMPPIEFVQLTAQLRCQFVGIALRPTHPYNPQGYPDWSLRDDAGLRRDLAAATADCGVGIALVEGFAILPEHDIRDSAHELDAVVEIGCGRIAVANLDRDPQRAIDGLAFLAGMAAERGLQVSVKIGSMKSASRLDRAIELARAVAMPNFSLLIDTMHFFRLGSRMGDLVAVDPALIGYVQLCDVPLAQQFDSYIEEALHERLAPGDGELPLRDFLSLLPADAPISLEVPMRSLAQKGFGPHERLVPSIAAARALLADCGAEG